jgi:hypothetical protein
MPGLPSVLDVTVFRGHGDRGMAERFLHHLHVPRLLIELGSAGMAQSMTGKMRPTYRRVAVEGVDQLAQADPLVRQTPTESMKDTIIESHGIAIICFHYSLYAILWFYKKSRATFEW